MLKSILFLLVMISLLTTPTRAYEAYNISKLNVLSQQLQQQEQELKKLPLSSQTANNTSTNNDMCAVAAVKAEQDYHIKPKLLQTIASVESGRYNEKLGRRVAWPWTIQANGKGYYYQSKQEAIAAIKTMQAQGITNIDVGCMQINLKYHKNAFKNIEDALDPDKNVAYSAKFLQTLYNKNGHNWQKTAMQYHSKNYQKGINYKNRLERHYAEHINPNAFETLF